MSEPIGNGGEPSAQVCPECAAPRAPDGSPSCPCGPRAAEALRDARTAEAAAAEDFDPLRIRPYVELGDDSVPPPSREHGDTPTLAIPVTAPAPRPDSADVHRFEGEGPRAPTAATSTPGSTKAVEAVEAMGPTGSTPAPDVAKRSPRRRNGTTLAVAGAVATVLAAAGFATGLFAYDTPTRDRALPDDLRASAPDTSPHGETSETATSGTPQSTDASSDTSAGSSATSPSPTPSRSRASSSPSPSAAPTRTSPTPSATAASKAPGSDEADQQRVSQILRLGDDGPEVTELQLRLSQARFYLGDIDENFDEQVEAAVRSYQFIRGITDDEPGVYGVATRNRLESETNEPQSLRTARPSHAAEEGRNDKRGGTVLPRSEPGPAWGRERGGR